MRIAVKTFVRAISLLLMFPWAFLALFGRFQAAYIFFAQAASLIPGIPGDYLRAAYYHMTLRSFSLDTRMAFGSYFSKTDTQVGEHVTIGPFCVFGRVRIGDRTFFGPAVQLLSGARQHTRDASARLIDGEFAKITIGEDCWIGASAIVMADIGSGSTVAAGAVVTAPVSSGVVVGGNPARLLHRPETETASVLRGADTETCDPRLQR